MEFEFTHLAGVFLAVTIVVAWNVWQHYDCGFSAVVEARRSAAFTASGILLLTFGLSTFWQFSQASLEADISNGFLGSGGVLVIAGLRIFVLQRDG
ncbi:hypothetical protein C4571_00815 [Candidatus Parcubacteria bacterium]|nr:MAG: hypothetical protein C4571_00815 [Candidatus Parcubacteria bacterium]